MPTITPPIDTIVTIGVGEVTQTRHRPAHQRLRQDGLLQRTAYLDLQPECPFPLLAGEEYVPLSTDCVVPFDVLAQRQLLGPHVLLTVATPTRFHVLYAKEMLGAVGRIAVEKPLALQLAAAESLVPFSDVVYAIAHSLWKTEMLTFLTTVKEAGL